MAVEDAAVLGDIFSRLKGLENIGFMLSTYQELRQSRCNYVQADEERKTICYSLCEDTHEDIKEQDKELEKKHKYNASQKLERLWETGMQLLWYVINHKRKGGGS